MSLENIVKKVVAPILMASTIAGYVACSQPQPSKPQSTATQSQRAQIAPGYLDIGGRYQVKTFMKDGEECVYLEDTKTEKKYPVLTRLENYVSIYEAGGQKKKELFDAVDKIRKEKPMSKNPLVDVKGKNVYSKSFFQIDMVPKDGYVIPMVRGPPRSIPLYNDQKLLELYETHIGNEAELDKICDKLLKEAPKRDAPSSVPSMGSAPRQPGYGSNWDGH